jgi:hypothetical protein
VVKGLNPKPETLILNPKPSMQVMPVPTSIVLDFMLSLMPPPRSSTVTRDTGTSRSASEPSPSEIPLGDRAGADEDDVEGGGSREGSGRKGKDKGAARVGVSSQARHPVTVPSSFQVPAEYACFCLEA